MGGVKVASHARGMTIAAARQCGQERAEWRALAREWKLMRGIDHVTLCGPFSCALVPDKNLCSFELE